MKTHANELATASLVDEGRSPMTTTVTLKSPIFYKDQTFDALSLREVKVKDLVAAENVDGATNKQVALLASISGIPAPVLMEMGLDDYDAVSIALADIMGNEPGAAGDA